MARSRTPRNMRTSRAISITPTRKRPKAKSHTRSVSASAVPRRLDATARERTRSPQRARSSLERSYSAREEKHYTHKRQRSLDRPAGLKPSKPNRRDPQRRASWSGAEKFGAPVSEHVANKEEWWTRLSDIQRRLSKLDNLDSYGAAGAEFDKMLSEVRSPIDDRNGSTTPVKTTFTSITPRTSYKLFSSDILTPTRTEMRERKVRGKSREPRIRSSRSPARARDSRTPRGTSASRRSASKSPRERSRLADVSMYSSKAQRLSSLERRIRAGSGAVPSKGRRAITPRIDKSYNMSAGRSSSRGRYSERRANSRERPESEEVQMLSVGTQVRMKGLSSKLALNGKLGVIHDPFDRSSRRYHVRILGSEDVIAVRTTHLDILSGPRRHSSTSNLYSKDMLGVY